MQLTNTPSANNLSGFFTTNPNINAPTPAINIVPQEWYSDSGNSPATTQPKIMTNTGGVQIQTGQTTFDKVLNTITSMTALFKGANYVPTTTIPANNYTTPTGAGDYQTQLLLQQMYQQQNSLTGKAATGIENFVKENTGLLLIGGVGLFLFMSGRK